MVFMKELFEKEYFKKSADDILNAWKIFQQSIKPQIEHMQFCLFVWFDSLHQSTIFQL